MIEVQGIKFYTVADAAKILQVTPQTIRKYIKSGDLPAQRIGRPLLITEQNIKEFLKVSL